LRNLTAIISGEWLWAYVSCCYLTNGTQKFYFNNFQYPISAIALFFCYYYVTVSSAIQVNIGHVSNELSARITATTGITYAILSLEAKIECTMQLSYYGIEYRRVQQAVNQLFRCNLVLP